MLRHALLACIFAAVTAPSGVAQEAEDRIVVTASRMLDFESDEAPHVVLKRRADSMALTITLECDTRDLSDRESELRATLRNLQRAAGRSGQFELGLIVDLNDMGDQQVLPFTPGMVEGITLSPSNRADTSRVTLSILTDIGSNDTLEALQQRFDRFLDDIDLVGRSQFLPARNTDLTITGGPARYRNDLIASIAEDARATAARFGEGYDVSLSGLEGIVRWQTAGPLSLNLYIDYELTVQPR